MLRWCSIRMAKEEKQFDINDVCDEVCKSLAKTPPFSDTKADTPEVLKNWEEIKSRQGKHQKVRP